MPFADRHDAGCRLAEALLAHRGEDAVVLALPRGGVAVARPIAEALKAPMDLILVRKIGAPRQPEVAMAAIVDGDDPAIIRNDDVIRCAGVSDAEFQQCADLALAEIERRRRVYRVGRPATPITGKTVIVVDDGVATGATLKAALLGIKKKRPLHIIVAVPVAPAGFAEALRSEVDEFVCLEALEPVGAVGFHYHRFDQVSDAEVVRLLLEAKLGHQHRP
jgi:putative phosphoribosyl transferase